VTNSNKIPLVYYDKVSTGNVQLQWCATQEEADASWYRHIVSVGGPVCCCHIRMSREEAIAYVFAQRLEGEE